MSTISVKATKSGDYLKVLPVAGNQSKSRFGVVDMAVLTFFLLSLSGLVFLLLAN